MKKFFLLFICLFLFTGCADTVKTVRGSSLAYSFFKGKYTDNKYHLELFDRNVSKNDGTKIIMIRDNNNYFYEVTGDNGQIVIQKDNYKYMISPDNLTYFKDKIISYDNPALGILPFDLNSFKKMEYETGKERVFGRKYVYEKFDFKSYTSTYYFNGDKLIYIRFSSPTINLLYKFSFVDKKIDKNVFKIDKKYSEITY